MFRSGGVQILLLVGILLSPLAVSKSLSQDDSPIYTAKQRVVYTDGRESWLMNGDPEQASARYSGGSALPVLLTEGWRVASVTPASNAEAGHGKTLVVLEITVPPYNHQLTIPESDKRLFPRTRITVGIVREKTSVPNPNWNPNARIPDPSGPTLQGSRIVVKVSDGDKQLKRYEMKTSDIWDLKNGYSLQIVKIVLKNEMHYFTIRLFSN